MKIGIDARLFGTQHAGIGRYTEELIKNLQGIDNQNEYVIFCRKKDFDQIPGKRRWEKVIADVPHYTLGEQVVLSKILSKEKLDLLHFPHFNVPLLYRRPFVVTIHDILWHNVRGFGATTQPAPVYLIKYLGYRLVVRNALLRAIKILVPSKAVKDELVNRFNIPQDKLVVTYEGVDEIFQQTANSQQQTTILTKYKIRKPYVIYAGSAYPHKNLERLIQAVKHLNDIYHLSAQLSLFIVSARSVFLERTKRAVHRHNASLFVNFLGFVPDAELAVLYREALAFVFPTLSEGFGLPGLEAMAAGTPVICSDITVLREVYGDAALYFNPLDATDIADKIKQIIVNQKLRGELIAKGKHQVEKYSWGKMVKETLRVYGEALFR